MKLIVTIDTEEDNWGQYDRADYSLENIEKIDGLQELFDRYEVTPTYLVTYPVATDMGAIDRLRRIMEEGRCEIGTHCHPWNTPPFEEMKNDRNSMLCNLSEDLQLKKIDTLHQVITRNFGVVPTSFRAGRWGFGGSTARCLSHLGYTVDSSIIAFQNWEIYGGPDYSHVFPRAFTLEESVCMQGDLSSRLLEVPATAAFKQQRFGLCNKVWQKLGGKFMQKLHLRGILGRLGLLNKIWLSPENSSASDMIRLANTMIRQDSQILNLFFHSTALKAGISPFVITREDEAKFLQRIEEFLVFTRNAGIESIKLSDAPAHVEKGAAHKTRDQLTPLENVFISNN